jgi:hypothetical protein
MNRHRRAIEISHQRPNVLALNRRFSCSNRAHAPEKQQTLIGVAVVVAVAVNWRFKGYEDLPELARPYATSKNRRLSLFIYWGVMLGFIVVAWLVLGLRKMHS